MRNSFINRLNELAKNDKSIIMIVGDLGFGNLSCFYEELPDQFINAGIAEQNMAGVAAALGMENKKPYMYSIGNFNTLRCVEQIRNDILYHDSNVKIVSVGAGFGYGPLGMSHHATEDIAIMRSLPNIIVFTPSDPEEARQVADLTVSINKPAYVRLGKGKEPSIHENEFKVEIGKGLEIFKGEDVAIFVAGPGSDEGYEAAKELNSNGISTGLYSFPTIKPIDKDLIKNCFQKYKIVITIEEHNIIGGLYSAVSEVVSQSNNKAILRGVALNDEYTSVVGSQKYLRNYYNINKETIIKIVKDFLGV